MPLIAFVALVALVALVVLVALTGLADLDLVAIVSLKGMMKLDGAESEGRDGWLKEKMLVDRGDVRQPQESISRAYLVSHPPGIPSVPVLKISHLSLLIITVGLLDV